VELADLRFERFKTSHDEQDLDAAILQYTHTIFLPFHHPTGHRQGAPVTAILVRLSMLLVLRSRKSKQLSDVRYSAHCLRYLRDRSLQVEGFDITPFTHSGVTASLVCALALQVDLERGNAMHGIEEMSVLCRELLSSDALEQDLNPAVESFAGTLLAHMKDTFDHPSQQVIKCLCEANTRLPDSHPVSLALSLASSLRFRGTKSDDDYECAMGHLDKLIASRFPVCGPDKTLRQHLSLAATLAVLRSLIYRNPEHLEEAISRTRAHLGFVSIEDPERGEIIRTLAELVRRRAKEFDNGVLEGHFNDPVADDLPPVSQLAASPAESDTVKAPSTATESCLRHFKAIVSAGRITDKAEIHKAVQYCRLLRPSLQQSSDPLRDVTLLQLGEFLSHAFELTNEPEYLNESIDIYRSILKVRRAQWMHFYIVGKLTLSLSTRLELSNDRNDLDQMIQLFPIISDCPDAKAHGRLMGMTFLARYSRAFQHPFTPVIYNRAISLMSDSLVFAPTLEIQHFRLIQLNVLYEELPLDYASYQVQRGQLKEAVETLEQGRGLIWSQMRGFRSPIDQLWVVNSLLAEELTTSTSPSVLMNSVEADDGEEIGFDRVLAEHQKLSNERNSLIARIRALPGFENFLMIPSYDTLHSAAACGPVIVISHSKWRERWECGKIKKTRGSLSLL